MLPAFSCDPENSALLFQVGKGGGGDIPPPPNFTVPRRARSHPSPPPPRASDLPQTRPPPGTIPRTHPKPLPPRGGPPRIPSSEKPFNYSLSDIPPTKCQLAAETLGCLGSGLERPTVEARSQKTPTLSQNCLAAGSPRCLPCSDLHPLNTQQPSLKPLPPICK